MTPVLAAVLALAVGAALGWLAQVPVIRLLRHEREESRKAEAIASDRLLHAWKDGAMIAPRPSEPLPPPEPLPQILRDAINDWEDPEHRAELEREARQELAFGRQPLAILRSWEDNHR